jgi:two-component system sensor kinase FixL
LNRPLAFLAAAAITAAVVWARWALQPVLGGEAPLLLLLFAPMFAAAWFGLGPGLFATALAAAAGMALFIPADASLIPPNAAEWLRVSTFVAEGTLFSWLFEERRRALDESGRREQRFRDALEAAPSGMILAERSGRIAFANARARAWFGYRASEF